MVFAGYSGFLHQSQLTCHDIVAKLQRSDEESDHVWFLAALNAAWVCEIVANDLG